MAAPERFADTPDSFPLHRGRRPYMAPSGGKHFRRYVRCHSESGAFGCGVANVQEENWTFARIVRVQPCIRPLNAAVVAAGPDVIR